MSSLDGTISLEEMDDISMRITQQLNLDMSRFIQKSLDEDSSISKSRLGFTDCTLETVFEGFLISYDTHASSSASHCGFDDHWEANFLDKGIGEVVGFNGSLGTGYDGDAGLDGCKEKKADKWSKK